MIIKSYSDIPYGTCQAARIRPKGKGKFSGSLCVGGVSYDVSITRDEDHGEQDRVWARVRLVEDVSSGVVDSYAISVAEKALADDEWSRLKVDLRDGETAYMRTWTHDFPDDHGMDSFLSEAARFIESHIGELFGLNPSGCHCVDFATEDDFDLSVL